MTYNKIVFFWKPVKKVGATFLKKNEYTAARGWRVVQEVKDPPGHGRESWVGEVRSRKSLQ